MCSEEVRLSLRRIFTLNSPAHYEHDAYYAFEKLIAKMHPWYSPMKKDATAAGLRRNRSKKKPVVGDEKDCFKGEGGSKVCTS